MFEFPNHSFTLQANRCRWSYQYHSSTNDKSVFFFYSWKHSFSGFTQGAAASPGLLKTVTLLSRRSVGALLPCCLFFQNAFWPKIFENFWIRNLSGLCSGAFVLFESTLRSSGRSSSGRGHGFLWVANIAKDDYLIQRVAFILDSSW